MTVSPEGIQFIAAHEGLSLTAYADSSGLLTIGYGHIDGVHVGDTCTEEQALAWLQEDAQNAAACVDGLGFVFTQNQFDALTDFAFNLGCGALYKMVSHGFEAIPTQMLRWDHAGGVVVAGLAKRRQDEVALYNTPEAA